MQIETVRINEKGRHQLIRLKRFTGIETFNVLCRWALCISLAEETRPPRSAFRGDTAVEMTWRVFGGARHNIYLALIKNRCLADGIEITEQSLNEELRLHVHRGLGYLAADKDLRSIDKLLEKVEAA